MAFVMPGSSSLLDRPWWRGPWRARAVTSPEDETFTLGVWSVRAVDVGRRRAVDIECLAGELLVTCERDPEDHIVAAGQALRVEQRGRVVVTGTEPTSRVRVRHRPPRRVSRSVQDVHVAGPAPTSTLHRVVTALRRTA